MTEFSDVCPKCGHEVEDLDGFGMLCDLGPDGCGWCSHPNITDGQCGFCGRMMEDRPSMDTLSCMDTQDLVARLDACLIQFIASGAPWSDLAMIAEELRRRMYKAQMMVMDLTRSVAEAQMMVMDLTRSVAERDEEIEAWKKSASGIAGMVYTDLSEVTLASLDDYDWPARMDRAEEQIADLEAKLAEARFPK